MTQIVTTIDGVVVTTVATINAYASPAAITTIFGSDNVTRWADLDNTFDSEVIAGRQAWALALATEEINTRLLGGIYAIPFVAPVPYTIQDLTARLAGCLLYDARRIADLEGPDEDQARYDTQPHRRMVIDGVRAIRSGKKRLPGQAQVGTTVPQSAARFMSGGSLNSYYNNGVNPELTIWLPFIWSPQVVYPPVWCGGGMSWSGAFGWW